MIVCNTPLATKMALGLNPQQCPNQSVSERTADDRGVPNEMDDSRDKLLDEEYEADAEPILSDSIPRRLSVEKNDSTFDSEFGKPSYQEFSKGTKAQLTRMDSIDDYNIETDTPVGELGQLKVESSAVEVANSSDVHIGHKLNKKTVFNFERATSVVVDRRQITIVKTPTHEAPTPKFGVDAAGKPENGDSDRPPIVDIVRNFNRNRYRDQLAHITPLPWWTWFSPHLDNVFTGVQMVASDRFDGRCDQSTIQLKQIFLTKQNDCSAVTTSLPCRILIESNPGYGKTTLTLKMASDWASDKQYISMFHLVFRIPLREFQGDLQNYIFRELFPQHEVQGREDWWLHLKNNHQNVLFLLDGLDELHPQHRGAIDMLLRGNIFDKVSIVATSRTVPSDDPILCFFNRRIELRGFNPNQTEQFIQNYFQFKQKPKEASRLISLINGPCWYGRHLTACPLTCLFLCVVFEDEQDEGTLHKMTQIYQGLTSWLVRRIPNKRQKGEANDLSSHNLPIQDYEQALASFGELCLKALSRGEAQFTSEQLQTLPENAGDLILDLGLLIRSTGVGGNILRMPKNVVYQPIHKTFLEYFSALYLSEDLEDRFNAHINCLESPHLTKESVVLILKFLAGLLGENAAQLFRLRTLSSFQLPPITLFELLHESGPTPENVRALSSILDDEIVTVHSNPIELDGWAGLLAAPDCPIRSLKFIWASAPFSNASLDRFFAAFQSNHSVTCLVVTAANGFSPNDNDAVVMGAFTVLALKKACLRHFSLHLVGDTWSAKVVGAINNMLNHSRQLTSLKINVDMGTEQVVALCQGLRHSNVKSLVLPKLSCDPQGFAALSTLVKSLDHLSVSLNLMKAIPSSSTGMEQSEGSPQDLQSLTAHFVTSAKGRAGISIDEDSPPDCSDLSEAESNIESAISLLAFLEENVSGSFRLAEIARLPVAIGVAKIFHVDEPLCQKDQHCSGFHELFASLRDPDCQLTKLDLTGCYLSGLDMQCLGEILRNCPRVQYLRVADLKRFNDVLPTLGRTGITWLDVSSSFIFVGDEDLVRLLRALSTAEHLRYLSLAGWKFSIKHAKLLDVFNKFMDTSPIKELNLAQCRFRIDTSVPSPSLSTAHSCVSLLHENSVEKRSENRAAFRSRKTSSQGSMDEPESQSLNSSFDLDETNTNCSINVSSKEKTLWPNLNKLSLKETTVSLKVQGQSDYRTLSGPLLFAYLQQCRNLTELSLSLKPVMPESPSLRNMVSELNDASTKEFFSSVQRRLGHSLKRLSICFCIINWSRPSQTSASVVRSLLKCEKLVSLELNYLKFRAKQLPDSASQRQLQSLSGDQEDSNHWLLEAIISGCPHLEDLSLVGTRLNITQAVNFAIQVRDHWKGSSLSIHTLRMGQDEEETDEIVSVIQQIFKDHRKFHTEYVGGYRGTLIIRRRKHLCGIVSRIRHLKIGILSISPRSGLPHRESFLPKIYCEDSNQRQSEHSSENAEELRTTLPPGQRSLFGLTPFDYSILLAHAWNLNKW